MANQKKSPKPTKNFGNKILSQTIDRLKALPWKYISLVLITLFFFSFVAILTYDSGHYLGYVSIFEGNAPASSWDIVRGPVFPGIIYLFNVFFGKTNAGILVGLFVFYLIFICICYKILDEICQNYKHKKLIKVIAFIILTLNPLIFGYFHVLLTEFVAITITMLNILMAYRWLFIKHNKKSLILYAVYFVFSTIFCYHLKQPYIIIAIIPPLTAAIISIVKNHRWKNILYRFGTIVVSGIFLLFSILAWNGILDKMGVNKNTGRDSASMLGQQLLLAYQIPYDNDGDGQNDKVSTTEAVGIILSEFIKNPKKITKIYLQNYCGLTSMCEITTPNGHDFFSTGNLVGLATYENTFIGYSTFREEPNVSPMKEEMTARASVYEVNTYGKNIFAKFYDSLRIPSNVLFKIATVTYPIFLIFIIVIHHKDKKREYSKLFYLNIILLTTTAIHMIVSAGIGLIIDRYAVEIVAPSLLGIFGSITYSYQILKNPIKEKFHEKKK